MATFSEQQITDLADCLALDTSLLEAHLASYEPVISESAKTKVLARLASYALAENSFASFTATESNKGFNLDANSEKEQLKNKIANLLFLTDTLKINSSNRLQRS